MSGRLLLGLMLIPAAASAGVPLPPAPVRIVIPDAAALDASLTGAYRRALTGAPDEGDPVVAAWRRSQVGAKLEDQWSKLAGDLPWTWTTVLSLRPRAIGFALLDAGGLDAVMVVEGGAAGLPAPLRPGTARGHGGIPYHVVAQRAPAGAGETERRMGLAWAQTGDRLLLATSEEALTLALDELLAGRSFEAPLAGLVSIDLDAEALAKDRYFRREFLFGPMAPAGHVRAALRLEGGHLVEVREGQGDPGPTAALFEAPGAAAAAWETDAEAFLDAVRGGLLEPVATRPDRPVEPIGPLPSATPASTDRYLVDLRRPPAAAMAWEEGDVALWRDLLRRNPVSAWGYTLSADGRRRIVFRWPASLDADVLALCSASVARRGGPTATAAAAGAKEIRVGPDLPALAMRRTGEYLWLAGSAAELVDAPTPAPSSDVVRWARVDLEAVRTEAARWARAEGPSAPERIRPFSDRILGLLGWMPEAKSLEIERRRSPTGWTERIVFGTAR